MNDADTLHERKENLCSKLSPIQIQDIATINVDNLKKWKEQKT